MTVNIVNGFVVLQMLIDRNVLRPGQSVRPNEAERSDLLRVHTAEYLDSLKNATTVARISEVCPLVAVSFPVLKRN